MVTVHIAVQEDVMAWLQASFFTVDKNLVIAAEPSFPAMIVKVYSSGIPPLQQLGHVHLKQGGVLSSFFRRLCSEQGPRADAARQTVA